MAAKAGRGFRQVTCAGLIVLPSRAEASFHNVKSPDSSLESVEEEWVEERTSRSGGRDARRSTDHFYSHLSLLPASGLKFY